MRLAALLLIVSVHVSLSADECDGLFVQLVNGKGLKGSDAFATIKPSGKGLKDSFEFKTGEVQDSNDPVFTAGTAGHCWKKEYESRGKRHTNGFRSIKLASAINVKLFDQDGDPGTDDDITAMGECVLDPTKADAKGKLTCSLVNIVDGKEEDAGTLEFLVTDKGPAEELRNKNAAAPPPKCEILPVVGNGKQKSKCLNEVSSFVVLKSRSMLTNARNLYAFRTFLCHSNKSACILTPILK